MADNLFSKLSKAYYGSAFAPRSAQARKWFMDKLREYKLNPTKLYAAGKTRLTVNELIGGMYFFHYDAKLKKELPYWDAFPLVIPIDFYKDGFLGVNLHYLDYKTRAILLDKLMENTTNKQLDERTRMRMNYNMMKQASKYREIQPCVKRYLYSHIKSKFLPIHANEWEMAILLPVESFQKADKKHVFQESRKAIRSS